MIFVSVGFSKQSCSELYFGASNEEVFIGMNQLVIFT